MRELSISLDDDAEISLRIFMERTRTASDQEAVLLALRSAALLTDRHWLSEVIGYAVREIPMGRDPSAWFAEEPTPGASWR